MKQVFSKYTRLLAAGFVLPMIACAQGDFDSAAIDNVFADFNAETPGCALGVVQSGQLVYGRGYGMANLEHGLPINTASIFRIGSVSKQFAAAVAALAAMEGLITLSGTVAIDAIVVSFVLHLALSKFALQKETIS